MPSIRITLFRSLIPSSFLPRKDFHGYILCKHGGHHESAPSTPKPPNKPPRNPNHSPLPPNVPRHRMGTRSPLHFRHASRHLPPYHPDHLTNPPVPSNLARKNRHNLKIYSLLSSSPLPDLLRPRHQNLSSPKLLSHLLRRMAAFGLIKGGSADT
ncbi:hypothetical protein CC80DRAFT_544932 [Byssothecium circinans]|uniref:Uncharacterized protein n=1 Tax=Byssothecium circinans TaxID=147558 RepID=A0A6A5U490_9PLEO|nr:hypothetical protein CC80DRAFT_544932 [Byssothecium circinans]